MGDSVAIGPGICAGFRLMDDHDIWALMSVSRKLRQSVDFELIFHTLLRSGFITEERYAFVWEDLRGSQEHEKFRIYIREIANTVTLRNLMVVLKDNGLDDVAFAIVEERFSEKRPILPSESPHGNSSFNLYKTLAKKIGNLEVSVSMRADFQTMTTFLTTKICQETCTGGRQEILDKLSVVVAVRVFVHGCVHERNAILAELKDVCESNGDLDLTSATAVYLISKCYIARKQGAMDDAESFVAQAHQLCFNHGNTWLKSLLFTAEQAMFRKQYTLTWRTDLLERSLSACDKALDTISDKSYHFKSYMS